VKKWAVIIVLALISFAFTRHVPFDKPARAGEFWRAARAGPGGYAA
jgi:tellurite resistance protein TehA-like permease